MENTGFKFESRIFYFIDLQNEEDYESLSSTYKCNFLGADNKQ